MLCMIGYLFLWTMKLIFRMMEIMLRLILFPIEVLLWALGFLFGGCRRY